MESRFGLLSGELSLDQAVIVGANGNLFIYRGSNDLAAQYDAPEADVERVRHAWAGLLGHRLAKAHQLGVEYIHTVVPEKSSAQPRRLSDRDRSAYVVLQGCRGGRSIDFG
jgi:hypothetical protein